MGKLKELRCSCNKLLCKAEKPEQTGLLELECKRCKKILVFGGGVLQYEVLQVGREKVEEDKDKD